MDEQTKILLHEADVNWAKTKQHEDQRAAITGLIVVIASAIQGGLTQIGFTKSALPLTMTLIVLGLFGILASAKLYERAKLHSDRAKRLRKRIDELHPPLQAQALLDSSDEEHYLKYGILATKIRLHAIWLTLHSMIALLGIVYTVIALVR